MSTRRTYEAIAEGLREAGTQPLGSPHSSGYVLGVMSCAEHIADALAKDHPGFDRERFLRDAGGETTAPPADPAASRHMQLQRFGLRVLEILEQEDDWSSDTLETISEAAHAHELASTDRDGMFMVRK